MERKALYVVYLSEDSAGTVIFNDYNFEDLSYNDIIELTRRIKIMEKMKKEPIIINWRLITIKG